MKNVQVDLNLNGNDITNVGNMYTKVEVDSKVVEISKSEYDALTEDKKNDGTIYFITDNILDDSSVGIVTTIDETSTDDTVPSAKSVYNAVNDLSETVDSINSQLPETSSANLNISLNGATGSVRFYKYGKIVCVYFAFVGELVAENTLYTFTGTIPSGYRPASVPVNLSINGVTSNQVTGLARITFAPNGNISIVANTNARREWIGYTCWYIL